MYCLQGLLPIVGEESPTVLVPVFSSSALYALAVLTVSGIFFSAENK